MAGGTIGIYDSGKGPVPKLGEYPGVLGGLKLLTPRGHNSLKESIVSETGLAILKISGVGSRPKGSK